MVVGHLITCHGQIVHAPRNQDQAMIFIFVSEN